MAFQKPLALTAALLLSAGLPASTMAQDAQDPPKAEQPKEAEKEDQAEQEIAQAKEQLAKVVVELQDAEVILVEAEVVVEEGFAVKTATDTVEEKKPDDEKKGDKELTEKELRERMQKLDQEAREARNKLDELVVQKRKTDEKERKDALANAVLPENPTHAQCQAYVKKLRKAAEGNRGYSSRDPIVTKLKEIPKEHIGMLLGEISNGTSLRYYANYAIQNIDIESLRESFIKGLDDEPGNIGIIVINGWCEDVRPTIIRKIESADGSLTADWFQAGVDLREPKLYAKLHEIATSSRSAVQFIGMLEALPDYDLNNTIQTCWEKSRKGKLSISQNYIAPMAAERGNVEALGVLISYLNNSSSYMYSYSSSSSSFNRQRIAVLKHIDFIGSNKEVQKWYKTNKDKIVFDHLTKRFVLPDDQTP